MVDVTQGDRDAAASVVYSNTKGSMNCFHADGFRDRILAGEWDHNPTVQAFAARRISAERAVVEWLRKEADDLIAEKKATDHWTPEWFSLREQIEDYQTIADRVELGEHLTPR